MPPKQHPAGRGRAKGPAAASAPQHQQQIPAAAAAYSTGSKQSNQTRNGYSKKRQVFVVRV